MKEGVPTVERYTIARQEIAIRSARKVAPRTRPSGSGAGSGARMSLRKPGPGALDHRGGFGGAPPAGSRARRSPARRRGAHRRRETRHAGGVSYVRTGGGDAPVPQHLGHCRLVSPAMEHFPGLAPAEAV
jgi:hypothetical protein